MTDLVDIGVSAAAGTPTVRVAILAGDRIVDMALPPHLPLREILPAVHRLLPAAGDLCADGDPPRRLSLAPIGGVPYSLDANLDTVGVVDGDLLALQPIPIGQPAQGVVEDIADAAVIFSAARLQPWGIGHIKLAARAAVLALILLATGLAAAHRISTGDAIGLYVLSALAAATVVGALLSASRRSSDGVASCLTAFVPLAAAFGLAVHGALGPAQLMLVAACTTAWSLICIILTQRGRAVFTAAAVLGAAVVGATATALIWHLPLLTLGCGLIAAALILTVQAPQLAALWARLPLPVIPAPGDPTPAAPALTVLQDLPRRIRMTDAHQTGFVAGAVLVSVVGTVAITWNSQSLSLWAWYVVAATAGASLLRARVWDAAACKAWLLGQPFLAAFCLVALFIAQARYTSAFGVLVTLTALSAGFVFVAANPRLAAAQSYTLPARRLLGLLATGLDASVIPLLAYLVGLFSWVLDR